MEDYIEHLVDNTLKKENAKEIISERISWYEMQLKGKQEEIERLNNIINELEKKLEKTWLEYKDTENQDLYIIAYEDKNILDYIQELKGESSNE